MSRPQAVREIAMAFNSVALIRLHNERCEYRRMYGDHCWHKDQRENQQRCMFYLARALRQLRPAQQEGKAA